MGIDIIDFHTHILPKLDHGSASLEVSKAQVELACKSGVNKIFATSHFYPHRHSLNTFLEKRDTAYKQLYEGIKDIGVEIRLAAEVLLCEGLDKFEGLKELCIYGTDYLLLELPFTGISNSLINTVEKICNSGIKVILAHADRYHPDIIEHLLTFGVNIQLNADALSTLFKNKTLYSWIDAGYVVGIGSDIHGADAKAYKKFSKALTKLGDKLPSILERSNEIWEKALRY